MGNLKTDEDDDFITSASPETEPDEADAAFDAKEKKKKQSNIISRIILIICACVFVFAAVKLVSILLEYKKGNDIYNNIEGDVLDDTPVNITIDDDEAPEVTIPFVYNHQALLDINSDGLGFLYVPSVDIRLPIAQTTDNDFYLTHTFDKTYNRNGCLFVADPVSNTFTFNFSNLTGLREYAKVVKAESLYDTGVDVSNATQVVTFSTCTDDSKQRVIVSGTYVGESKLDNGTSSEASVSASE